MELVTDYDSMDYSVSAERDHGFQPGTSLLVPLLRNGEPDFGKSGTTDPVAPEICSVPKTQDCMSKSHFHLNYYVLGRPDAPIRILFIMGWGTASVGWTVQVRHFAGLKPVAKSETTEADPKNNDVSESSVSEEPKSDAHTPPADMQICVYDLRGVGWSSCPKTCTKSYGPPVMACDAHFLLNHLGWTTDGRGYHLVGISMGGMIAQNLAFRTPTALRSLTLLSTHAGGWAARPPIAGMGAVLSSMMSPNPKTHAHRVTNMIMSKKAYATPERRAALDESFYAGFTMIPPTRFRVVMDQLMGVFAHRTKDSRLNELGAFGFPVLLVTGTGDVLVHPRNTKRMFQEIRRGQLLRVAEKNGSKNAGESVDVSQVTVSEKNDAAPMSIDALEFSDLATNPDKVRLVLLRGAGHCINRESTDVLNIALERFFRAASTIPVPEQTTVPESASSAP